MTMRDRWIGWNATQRARNLQYIVNNSRFLILPWVQVKGLASTILARAARQLPRDWQQSYGYSPLLLETLVDARRFRGTCYRAANWICLGDTLDGEEWIVTIRRPEQQSSSSSFLSTATCSNAYVRLLRPSDAPNGIKAVNKYVFFSYF